MRDVVIVYTDVYRVVRELEQPRGVRELVGNLLCKQFVVQTIYYTNNLLCISAINVRLMFYLQRLGDVGGDVEGGDAKCLDLGLSAITTPHHKPILAVARPHHLEVEVAVQSRC